VTETEPFGLAILAIGLIGTAAVLPNRLSERLRVAGGQPRARAGPRVRAGSGRGSSGP